MAVAAPAIFAGIGAIAASATVAEVLGIVFLNLILTGLTTFDENGDTWTVERTT
jgi:hypothetical protein